MYYFEILDELSDHIGGRLRLSVLLQKRARELIKGYPKLVKIDSEDPIQIAFEELINGKIKLVKEKEDLKLVATGKEAKANKANN